MKKMFAFCLLLSISAATFSQADTSISSAMRTDYFKKSKNQKTIAWVMAGGGFTLAGIGGIIGLNDFGNDLDNGFNPNSTHRHDNGTVAVALIITGLTSMVGSIPLFISASHNMHKAMAITFNNDFVPGLQNNIVVKKPIEQVNFVLRF